MKGEGHNGHNGMLPHILGGKRDTPVQNGAQAVFKTHVGKDKFFFLIDQGQHSDQPVQATEEKDGESHPDQGATHEIVQIVHFLFLLIFP